MEHNRELELRRDLAQLQRLLQEQDRRLYALELGSVKRDGPLIDEIHAATRGLEKLHEQLSTREELQRALNAQTEKIGRQRNAIFGRREKIVGAIVAVGILALNLVQVVWK